MEELNDIAILLKKGTPLITISSYEEPRVMELCTRLAMQSFRPLFRWSITDGLVKNASKGMVPVPQHEKPEEVLISIRQKNEAGIYVLCDFHHHFDEPKIIRLIKDIALYASEGITLIFASHSIELPEDIRRYSARFELKLPTREKIRQIILDEAAVWQKANKGNQVRTDQSTLHALVSNLGGLTESEVKRLVKGAIHIDGAITESDVDRVNQAKFELMNMQNILTYEYNTAKFGDVGGLQSLKQWLSSRKDAFVSDNENKDTPKGVMLLGVQGGGKSLAAKAIAGLWNVPLLKLDMAALYNKYHGETERNLRETLSLADNVSPCVLWMDEIEKALGRSDNEGVSHRVLGTLLSWMAERKSPVFIVATSNDIQSLPPELIRKGRLDEIFFVDLPNQKDRGDIIKIHTQSRDISLNDNEIEQIAELSEGFTGAEIEQAIVSARYSRKSEKQHSAQFDDIAAAIQSTVPLSVTRAEDVHALRHWASTRAVSAN